MGLRLIGLDFRDISLSFILTLGVKGGAAEKQVSHRAWRPVRNDKSESKAEGQECRPHTGGFMSNCEHRWLAGGRIIVSDPKVSDARVSDVRTRDDCDRD